MAMTETVQVEVALALPERQELVVLQVAAGTTARQAVELSGCWRAARNWSRIA